MFVVVVVLAIFSVYIDIVRESHRRVKLQERAHSVFARRRGKMRCLITERCCFLIITIIILCASVDNVYYDVIWNLFILKKNVFKP